MTTALQGSELSTPLNVIVTGQDPWIGLMSLEASLADAHAHLPPGFLPHTSRRPSRNYTLSVLCRLPGEPSCRASFGPQRNRPCPERLRDRGEVIT